MQFHSSGVVVFDDFLEHVHSRYHKYRGLANVSICHIARFFGF